MSSVKKIVLAGLVGASALAAAGTAGAFWGGNGPWGGTGWNNGWGNGWAAIADSSSQEVAVRLGAAKDILREHGNYSWLTEKGSFVILNNGIEFAITYMLMLLSLLFTGGGRYVSVDYYLSRLYPASRQS